jgi:hypothetical protein
VLGLAVTSWYDRRKLDRIAPDTLAFVERAIESGLAERAEQGEGRS